MAAHYFTIFNDISAEFVFFLFRAVEIQQVCRRIVFIVQGNNQLCDSPSGPIGEKRCGWENLWYRIKGKIKVRPRTGREDPEGE
jgi:hypothetical protein